MTMVAERDIPCWQWMKIGKFDLMAKSMKSKDGRKKDLISASGESGSEMCK